jgi:hypothetical protein
MKKNLEKLGRKISFRIYTAREAFNRRCSNWGLRRFPVVARSSMPRENSKDELLWHSHEQKLDKQRAE